MLDGQIKELSKGIQDVLVAIGKIETEIQHLSKMATTVAETQKLAIQLEQSTKSAHKRIDALQKEVDELAERVEQKEKAGKDDKKWLVGVLLAALSFIVALSSHMTKLK